MRRYLPVGIAVASLGFAALSGMPAAHAGISFDVSIAKTHSGDFTVGQNGTFNITLHNSGPSATGTDDFTVTDTLPTGLTYVSDTASTIGLTCNAAGQVVTCTGQPSIGSGNDKSFALTVSVSDAARPSKTNTVSFDEENNADTNSDNNSDSDTVNVDPAETTTTPTPTPTPTPSPTHASASPTASVAGNNANQLPFTGFPGGLTIAIALVMVVAGAFGFAAAHTSDRTH